MSRTEIRKAPQVGSGFDDPNPHPSPTLFVARRHRSLGNALLGLFLMLGFTRAWSETVDQPSPTDGLTAVEQDIARLLTILVSDDEDSIDEALVQLWWAGISDRRLYDPLIDLLESQQVTARKQMEFLGEALSYSGNPEIYQRLRNISENRDADHRLRRLSRNAIKGESVYTAIAMEMRIDTNSAATVEDLWAMRHHKGLRVTDGSRMRLAARDLYLHRYGVPSLDVAAEVVKDHIPLLVEDDNVEDAVAFLCKALGLSVEKRYLPLLIEAANYAANEKIADYAERSAQYLDPTFVAHREKD